MRTCYFSILFSLPILTSLTSFPATASKDSLISVDTIYMTGQHSIVYKCGYEKLYTSKTEGLLFRQIFNKQHQLLAEGFVKRNYYPNVKKLSIEKEVELVGYWKYYYNSGRLRKAGAYKNKAKAEDWVYYSDTGEEITKDEEYDREMGIWIGAKWEWPYEFVVLHYGINGAYFIW